MALTYLFGKFVALGVAIVGLPLALLSRKWFACGAVGAVYLLSGAGLFVLYNSQLFGPLKGPPPSGATPQELDIYCEKLLKISDRIEAREFIGVARPSESSMTREMRELVEGAYKAGAKEVCLVNLQETDEAGVPIPDMVVILPAEDDIREKVLAWYRREAHAKRVAGKKFLYVDYS
jgi:hypothetical protein